MPACTRTWEALASRDGRLSEGASISFDQHCLRCRVCRLAADDLDAQEAPRIGGR